MNGKAYASLDVLSLTINFMTVFLHVTLFEISSELFYGISSVLHTFSAASYIFYMPYFKQRTNFTKSALHSSVVCMIFIITVASYTSKGFFLLLGFLTLLPAHLTFVHHLLVKREEYLKSLNMEDLNSEFQFELFFRFKLEKTSEPESLMTVFSRFSENFHSKVSNLYYVWLAYFCLDYMKDERLALVKLTQTKFSKSSLSGDFEIFKCQAMIGDINLKYKDLAQVQCSMNLEKIIKYEGRFFEEFLYFLQIISKPSVYSPQVRKQVEVVNVLMKKLNEKYNEFIKLFPEFFQTLSNYPEFVKKIIGDEKKAKLLVSQQEYLKDKNSESFFSHNIGIVLISAELKDIGQILFANRIAFDLLGTSSTHLLGRSINDFVPKPFDRNHNFYLARHSTSCSDVHLSFPEEFIILNEQGFLMEVNLNIFMASVNTQNVYVMKFKKRDRRREIAIVDLSGNIFSHSELFGYYLGIQAKFLGNVNIKNVLEDLDLEKLRNERFLLYQLKRLTVAFMLIEITFRTRPIYLFIISENLNSPFTNDKSEVQKKVFFDSEVINLNNEEEFCRLSDVELSQKEEIKVDYGVSGKEETFDLLSNEKNDESTKLRVALTISEGLKRKSELNISIVSTIIEKNEVRTENLEVVYAKFSPDQEKLNQVLNSIKKKYFTLQVLTKVVVIFT
jgi:PAS domain-containing protein